MRSLLLLLVLVLVAASACGTDADDAADETVVDTDGSTSTTAQLRTDRSGSEPSIGGDTMALDEARRRWETERPQSFTFSFVVRAQIGEIGPIDVEVVDGETVSVESDHEFADLVEYRSIDDLFDEIERVATEGRIAAAVYDETYGYPVFADLDPIPNAIDDEFRIEVIEFSPTSE